MKALNKLTTYYDYDAQQWKDDKEGFEKFHIDQLDFLTSEEGQKISCQMCIINKLIEVHIKALESVGLTANF